MIQRVQVTWSRWDPKALKFRVSHPYVWIWTDGDGTERVFDSKSEAEAAKERYL